MTSRDVTTAPQPLGNSPTCVYVADASSSEIRLFTRDAGASRLQQVQRLALPAGVAPLTIAPGGAVVYAFLRGPVPRIVTLSRDSTTGELAVAAIHPVAHQIAYLQTDRADRYLLAASYADAVFSVYPIDANGRPDTTAARSSPTPPQAHCIVTDRTNRWLFVTALGGDRILHYRFDPATGGVTSNDPPFIATPDKSGPRHLVFHPAADIAYVNGELDGTIGVYALDPAAGRLTELQRVSLMPASTSAVPWAADLAIAPDGSRLYASERRTDTLAVFAIGADGRLEPRTTIATEAQPRSIAIDPSGHFLFVAGEASSHLATYAIDASTGGLQRCDRRPVGPKPAWVSVVGPPRF